MVAPSVLLKNSSPPKRKGCEGFGDYRRQKSRQKNGACRDLHDTSPEMVEVWKSMVYYSHALHLSFVQILRRTAVVRRPGWVVLSLLEVLAAWKPQSGGRPLCCPRQGSKGDGKLVSWEVWAALSEMLVCRSNPPALLPPATAAGVWQRAEEIRRAGGTLTADPAVNNTSRGEGFPHSHCMGEFGARSSDFGSGYGDVSFWADEDGSREPPPPKECCKAVGACGSGTSRKPPRQTSLPSSMPVVLGRPNSAPQTTSSASKGTRLHQTLATSRRSWSQRSRSQRQLRRGQGRTRGNNRGLRRSSSSPAHRHGAAYDSPAATFPNQKDKTPYSHRFSGLESNAEGAIATPAPRRRPMTAPVGETRSDTRGLARPAEVPARQRSCQSAHANARVRGVGDDGLRPDLGSNNSTPFGFGSHSLVGAWDGGAVADDGGGGDGGSEFEWRGVRTARDDMESGYLRTETASAKRKAAQYQTCMLEAQVTELVQYIYSLRSFSSSASKPTLCARSENRLMMSKKNVGWLNFACLPASFCGVVFTRFNVFTASLLQQVDGALVRAQSSRS